MLLGPHKLERCRIANLYMTEGQQYFIGVKLLMKVIQEDQLISDFKFLYSRCLLIQV